MLELAQKSTSPKVLHLLTQISRTIGSENLKPIITLVSERKTTNESLDISLIGNSYSQKEAIEMASRCEEPRAK